MQRYCAPNVSVSHYILGDSDAIGGEFSTRQINPFVSFCTSQSNFQFWLDYDQAVFVMHRAAENMMASNLTAPTVVQLGMVALALFCYQSLAEVS